MRILKLLYVILILVTGNMSCQNDPDILLNVPPTANAGPSTTITPPPNSVTLTGTGADSDGDVVAFLWSQVSGPGSTVIVNPGSPSTLISGFIEGTYVFQLMVTDDDGATGVDTVSVVVNEPPPQTLTLQPENNPGEYQLVVLNGANQSGSGAPDIPVAQWTVNSLPVTIRELLKFDLSSIPQNSTIVSANLFLYSYPPPTLNGNFTDANFGSTNAMIVQQVSTNWSPATTTWFNQPAGYSQSQIIVPHTTLSMLDLNIDVTAMVSSMVNANSNYGFLLKLQNEVIYNSRIFVSSYNTVYPAKRPKIVVVYH